MKKHKPKVNLYSIVSDQVDVGSMYGVRLAFKYSENPPSEEEIQRIQEHVSREVLNALSDVLRWD